MTTQYIYLILFCIVSYLIISDRSISIAFTYIFDLIKNKLIKEIWWIKNNPRNPIVKYLMWRRSMKMAEELQNEFFNKSKPE